MLTLTSVSKKKMFLLIAGVFEKKKKQKERKEKMGTSQMCTEVQNC